MFAIPRGFVYEPADLGFNDIAIAANTTVTGTILPLLARGVFVRFSLLLDTGPTIATPFNVSCGAGAWAPGTPTASTSPTVLVFATFIQNVPNNPRVKQAAFGNVGQSGFTTGGTVLAQGVANVLSAPFFALRVQNSDVANGATNVSAWVTLHE